MSCERVYYAGLGGSPITREEILAKISSSKRGCRVDFSGANLEGFDFLGISLVGARFSCADISGCIFDGCDLRAADFTGATSGTGPTEIYTTDFTGATEGEEPPSFNGANLVGACLHACRLPGADFASADMRGVNLSESDIQGAALWDADMRGADLATVDMRDALGRWTVVGSPQWRWSHCPVHSDETAMGADLVTADGVTLASCLVADGDTDVDSDCCGVTADGRAIGLSVDDIEWPDADAAAAAWGAS